MNWSCVFDGGISNDDVFTNVTTKPLWPVQLRDGLSSCIYPLSLFLISQLLLTAQTNICHERGSPRSVIASSILPWSMECHLELSQGQPWMTWTMPWTQWQTGCHSSSWPSVCFSHIFSLLEHLPLFFFSLFSPLKASLSSLCCY